MPDAFENSAALDPEVVSRFWEGVEKTASGCWLWRRTKRNGFHGSMSFHDRPIYVHRLSYALHFGPIPSGLFVLHRCDIGSCVRPDHLFLGTQAENVEDMFAKGRRPPPRGRYGVENHKATLTAEEVSALRRLVNENGERQRDVATKYGVSQSTVWRIARGQTRALQ